MTDPRSIDVNSIVPLQNLPKHERYRDAYRRFGFFWGLGIEHETYIMTSKTKTIRKFDGAMRPERYCVDYYSAYNQGELKEALADALCMRAGTMTVPVLMNGHSLTKCDVFGEHATTYERVPKPNPRFTGKTLFDWMCEFSGWMREEIGKTFMWDGDTIEFVTQAFYRATVDDVLTELQRGESRFVYELTKLPLQGVITTHGPFTLASPSNEPWASYLTNPDHVSMFNNGTIHINVTLPTQLGWDMKPMWPADFVEKHRRLARLVQWLEPLWIAAHGSKDPFSDGAHGDKFAAGSQRLAVSRYIGVGTFDTDVMPVGKILQVYKSAAGPMPWYDELHKHTAYVPLDVVGMDINFNKHWAHGLELRFFDQFPAEDMRRVLEQVVLLMDIALEDRTIPDPRKDAAWISMAHDALYRGAAWRPPPIALNALAAALGISEQKKESSTVHEALTWLFGALHSGGRADFCWENMVSKRPKKRCCSWWSKRSPC
jgi:hypothetical protein